MRNTQQADKERFARYASKKCTNITETANKDRYAVLNVLRTTDISTSVLRTSQLQKAQLEVHKAAKT